MTVAVLVNGVPASGKSSVANALSQKFGAPLFGLDTVKEALFSELGTGDRLHNRKMGRASYAAIWAVIGAFPKNQLVVVDAWFGFQPVELLQQHLKAAGVDTLVEVWCRAAPDVVARRYIERCGRRHVGHLGPEYAPELRLLAKKARPLGICPCIEVNTNRAVNIDAVAQQVDQLASVKHRPSHDAVSSGVAFL